MKKFTMINLTLLFVLGVLLATAAMAGDVDDIKKATMEHFATLKSGDAAAHVEHHFQGHSTFPGDGSLLQVDDSLDEETKALRTSFDSGVKLNLQLRHLEVKVYGKTAVVTGYVVGTTKGPDGKTQQIMNRRTAVLVKQGGKWKEVHLHSSPVVAAQPQ
ncbi:MAG: YybH family protein [bacterium]